MDLHWSFLLVPPAILYLSYQPAFGIVPQALTWYGSITLLLFVFVLIHELGHALTARARAVKAERIVLFPLGGGAFLPERPRTVLDEVLIYGAGPAANLLLALIALPILLWQPDGDLLLKSFVNPFGNYVVQPDRVDQLLGVTIAVNLLLALGNLLPAYPLDGGRILRALLRQPIGERPATVVVTSLGVLIGSLLIYLSWRLGDPLLGIGAAFIVGMSAVAFRDGWQRRRLDGRTVDDVMRPAAILDWRDRLYPEELSARALRLYSTTGWPVLPVYSGWNELRGFVAREVVQEEDPSGQKSIRSVAELEFVTARPGENLLVVTERIVAANVYGAGVYGKRGKLVGFVFTEDVMRVLGK